MDPVQTRNVLEACLLVAARPMTVPQLDALFEEDIDRPDRKAIREALAALAESYAERGIELVEVAGGWRLQTRASMAHWVVRLSPEKAPRYSRALLETLVLIAYRQPITRGEIEEVRGVAVSSTIVRTLQDRRWVREVGFKEVPGRPALLGTTSEFLDYFNLKRLDELPPLGELKDIEGIEAVLAAELDVLEGGEAANDESGESARGDESGGAAREEESVGVRDASDPPSAADASAAGLESRVEAEPRESEPSGARALSLSAVATRFVDSTDTELDPAPDDADDADDADGEDDGASSRAVGTVSERADIPAVAAVEVDEPSLGERSGDDDGTATDAVAGDDDASATGADGSADGSDVVGSGTVGPGRASATEAERVDAEVVVRDREASDDRGPVAGSTAAPAEVEADAPVSEAQTRMLDAVDEFAQEHRRELEARDEWEARIASAGNVDRARWNSLDAYPGGRPGAASSVDDVASEARRDVASETRRNTSPGREEASDDSPREGPATSDDGDP